MTQTDLPTLDQVNRAVDQMNPEQQTKVIANMINNMGFKGPKVAKELSYQHRTLQQNMMRFCGEYIRIMAVTDYDLRNQATVQFAKATLEQNEDKMYFPVI